MSVSSTVHNVARIVMETVKLKHDGRSLDTWIVHRINFVDEHGNTMYEITAHGLDNEPALSVVHTKDA